MLEPVAGNIAYTFILLKGVCIYRDELVTNLVGNLGMVNVKGMDMTG